MTSEKSRHELIMAHYPMTRQIAFRMARNFPAHIDVDDLIHIGVIGLIEAIDKYQPEKAPSFATYARIRVQGAILDEMRHLDWVPRSVRDRAKRIIQAEKALKLKNGKKASEDELAAYLEVSRERLAQLRRRSDVRVILSMEESGTDERRLGDTIASDKGTPQDIVVKEQGKRIIQSLIQTLPPREQQIVRMYYFGNLNFKDIAETLGVTESRISQIHSAIKRKLRKETNIADLEF